MSLGSGAPLMLQSGPGGRRFFLAGQPVHNGDVVELALADGSWLALRLEGMPGQILRYGDLPQLAGGGDLALVLPRCALFRWPSRRVGGLAAGRSG
jgi:hypothetical protein